MPTVIRLIWRFDHEVSFEYLDHLGRTLKELSESVEGFWQAASMGTLPYSLVAESRTDQLYRRISVELSNINGWIDWTSGIGIDGILKTEDFLNITRTTSSILGVTKVKRFNRAGIRFIMVCDKTVKIDRAEWTRSAIADNTYDMTTRLLGSISDIGLIFEGSDTDMLLYRVHFGPNDRNSLDRLLACISHAGGASGSRIS